MDANFIDFQRRRGIKILFPTYSFSINVENYGIKTIQKFSITVEKMDLQNLLQIRLTDSNDHSKMCICTIDNTMYDQIRLEQSLHVSFQGFIDHLMKILESCKKDELHMSLVKDETMTLLHFYEKRTFKNMTHLFLPVQTANTETILFHINQSLHMLQEQTFNYSNQMQKFQIELNSRDDQVLKLQSEIRSLNAKLMEQENLIFSRNTEEINRLQQTIKHINESKELEEKRLKAIINSMQEKIDQLNKESYANNDRMMQDSKKIESIRDENIKLKGNISRLREENDKWMSDLKSYQNRDGQNESLIVELRKQVNGLNDKCKMIEKQKSELAAELEAERNICQTKKNALQMTTEEITSSSHMINNLNKEILKLKSKIELRTEIAMRQEKLILGKEKENSELNETLKQIHSEYIKHRATNEEYAQTVKRIKETSDAIEEKYRRKINELILKYSQAPNDKVSIINNGANFGNRYLRPQNRIE